MKRVLPSSSPALLLLSLAALSGGCATVPKEAVELSYRIGTDLVIMRDSYDSMIAQRYEEFRAQRIAYLEDEWTPVFLNDFIVRARLVDIAKGQVVRVDGQWVPPTPGQEQAQLLSNVLGWSEAAVRKIDSKREELLGPLDAEEAEIRADLREAFDRLGRANTHITAHLNSIRKVHEVQAQALDKLGLTEVVAKLNTAVIEASNTAEAGLQEIRRADDLLDEVTETIDDLEDTND